MSIPSEHWHTICTKFRVRKDEVQSGPRFPDALRLQNNTAPLVNRRITPYQFSDASIHTHDPRHLLAKMTQIRIQCRSHGLINRDIRELIEIGRTLGISAPDTRKMIDLVRSIPSDASILDHLNDDLLTIGIDPQLVWAQRKTRVQLRVLIGLSIWAASIVIAMMLY